MIIELITVKCEQCGRTYKISKGTVQRFCSEFCLNTRFTNDEWIKVSKIGSREYQKIKREINFGSRGRLAYE